MQTFSWSVLVLVGVFGARIWGLAVFWVVGYAVPVLALKTKIKASGILNWDWWQSPGSPGGLGASGCWKQGAVKTLSVPRVLGCRRSGGPQAEPGVHQEGGAARLPGHATNRGERCAAFFCIQLHWWHHFFLKQTVHKCHWKSGSPFIKTEKCV